MQSLTFVTGNQSKAEYLSKYLDFPIVHQKIDLDEIQSLDLREVVEYKVRQAYDVIKSPVIVEDVSLEFAALGRLPGTFIKFFVEEIPFQEICDLLNGKSRHAVAKCIFGYCDDKEPVLFEGHLDGRIAQKPAGNNGYGWDQIFIPEGYYITRAQMNSEEYKKSYLQVKPFEKLKRFLETNTST